MEAAFWLSVALIGYVYAGYPLLIGAWACLRRARRSASAAAAGDEGSGLPGVTVIIAARNDEPRLVARVENILESHYPADRLRVIVALDGGTAHTVATLARLGSRVRTVRLPAVGKAGALNAAVLEAADPLLVFADARQRFAPDAVARLVSHFGYSQVGAVSGELVLDCEGRVTQAHGAAPDGCASTIGDGVGAYWRYEKWLRRQEALVGSTLGVTGAIYAMRRWLWQPLPLDTILDDVLAPMRLVLRGHRVIFESGAHAHDEAARDASAELRRKVRTLAGNFQLVAREPRLLLPVINPVWLQFVSHKLGRLVVPYALILLLLASAWLAPGSLFYGTALALQLAFYGLAAYGAVLDRRDRAVTARTTEVAHEVAG